MLKCLSVVEGYNIPFSTKLHQKRNRKHPRESSAEKSGGYGDFGDAGKESYLCGSERSEEWFFEQLIPSWEMRWGLLPSHQSDGTK